MTIDLGNGLRLVLAGLDRGWLWAGTGLVALVLLLLLYRYERRLVSARTGLALLGLRVLAGLALVMALFEPAATRTLVETLRGRVLVGVDFSDSMATVDLGRSVEQKEKLSSLLNLSPAIDPGTFSRREVTKRLLEGPWLTAIERSCDLETFGFARDLVPGSNQTLQDILSRPVAAGAPAGGTTDWEPLLQKSLDDSESRGRGPVVAVVLLSDGRNNGPPPPQPALPKLTERGIPVYGVLVGSSIPPVDAAIALVNAPDIVDKGQVARIDLTIKADGLAPGTEVPVVIERPGAEPLSQVIRAQDSGGRPVVSFRLPMEQQGEVRLTASVGPIPGDVRPDNDRRTLTITVADDKVRVLLVDAEPRWEFQYLRNALTRDERVELEAVCLNQPLLPGSDEAFYRKEVPAKEAVPQNANQPDADPLGAYDVLVLGDIRPSELSVEVWDRLEWYVAERGGTLVMTSGPRAWPGSLQASEVLRKLCPVESVRLMPVEAQLQEPKSPALPPGVPVQPTLAAAAGPWPMLQLADDAEANRKTWTGLPRLPWVVAGRPKPTATALATATAEPVNPGSDDDTTVLAAIPYGLGKVLWIGTDATWRWRFRAGDLHHHRFWGQVVQWSKRTKLVAGNRLVQFGPVPPRVQEHQPALVRARFLDTVQSIPNDLLVAVRVQKQPEENLQQQSQSVASEESSHPQGEPSSTSISVVPLIASPDQPRVYEAELPTLPAGRYSLALEVPQMAQAMEEAGGAPQATLEVTPRLTSEPIELAASPDALEALASATSGKLLADSEFDRLPALLQSRKVSRERTETTRLWDRPESLALFFGLLTLEWLLRKRAGLP